MGVYGLQSFVEGNCPKTQNRVKIATLLEEYRKEVGQVISPTIVVDGTGCLRTLYGRLDWEYGGQMKEFKALTESFVEGFSKLNIKLVFFFDGPTVEEKRPRWIDRRIQTMRDVDDILKSISINKPINSRHFILPPGIGNVARFIFRVVFNCEVHVSIKECDEEIAEYARINKCFAILAQDTDFIILKGARYYLSMGQLQLQTMETLMYDSSEVAEVLELERNLLPFLATLMGNDIVKKEQLLKFHNKLKRSTQKNLAIAVASFINELQINIEDDLEEISKRIAKDVFGNDSKSSLIKYSIESYNPVISLDDELVIDELECESEEWKNIVREALKRHRSGLVPPHIWAVMTGLPYELSAAIEDYHKSTNAELPFSGELYRPLRERIYGILLKEKPIPKDKKEHEIKEWVVVPGFQNSKAAIFVSPVYPTVPHPGLLALWSDTSEEIKNKKWDLFVRAISDTINSEELKKLEMDFIIPTVAIRYLYERDVISEQEAKAFIATAVVVNQSPVEWLRRLTRPPRANVRAVILSTLYNRSLGLLMMLVTGLGEPIPVDATLAWLSFDGKLFQKIYDASTRRKEDDGFLCNRKPEYLDIFYKIACVVFNDPDYKRKNIKN